MKKSKKSKIISIMLVVAMVTTMFLGTCSITFAETNSRSLTEASVELHKISAGRMSAARISSPVAAEINANTILSSASAPAEFNEWTIASGYYYVFQINPKYSGLLYLDASVAGSSGLTIGEYAEADGKIGYWTDTAFRVYGGGEGVYGSVTTATKGIKVTAGEPCYIYVENANTVNMDLKIRGNIYTTGTRTLPSGTSKWTVFSGKNASGNTSETWFKVTPQTTGTMTVSLKEFGKSSSSGYVTLYNSNKTAVSNKVYYYSGNKSNRVYFGVKKGSTYYLKVTNCSGSYSNQYKLGINYSVTSRIERALGYKSNAKKLYRSADATNTLFVASTSGNTDWYKFYVPTKRTTTFSINTSGIKSGTVYVTVYKGSTKIGSTLQFGASSNGGKYSITYGTTTGKANAGTYYIKVVKGTKASGKYSIRYVQ